jgi:membrane protein
LRVISETGGHAGQQPSRRFRWWELLERLSEKLRQHNVALLAGGIAMYGLLSVFPGLAAAVSIYGLFATPGSVIRHMKVFAGVLPPGVWDIFSAQLNNVAAHDHGTLTIAAVVGLLFALWSARLTMSALMTATNIAYERPEKRGFFFQMLTSLALTLGVIIGFLAMLLLGVIVPLTLAVLGGSPPVDVTVNVLRWAMLWGFAVLGLNIVYYFAPARERGRWHWISWGSAIAATLWLTVSGLFAFYVRTFSGYDRTYGALAGVFVLLMWFYLLSLFVILGAEINATLERPWRLPRTAQRRTQ